MNKELDELIHLAKKFPETDKAELRLFVHLEALCDEKLKALEIIKKKKVNVSLLATVPTLEKYNYFFDFLVGIDNGSKNWHLTKQEYDFLKEVLL